MELPPAMAYNEKEAPGGRSMDNSTELSKEMMLKVEKIRARDRRYSPEAYLLVIDAVESVLVEMSEMRHMSGSELCEGLRKLAVARFGPMAKEVLNFWGVRTTEDFGVIVFNLVEAGLLLKTEEDRIDDFLDVYDFDEVFERNYFKP
jgi:uncharacterized repeat protein (TIGR04138 family)